MRSQTIFHSTKWFNSALNGYNYYGSVSLRSVAGFRLLYCLFSSIFSVVYEEWRKVRHSFVPSSFVHSLREHGEYISRPHNKTTRHDVHYNFHFVLWCKGILKSFLKCVKNLLLLCLFYLSTWTISFLVCKSHFIKSKKEKKNQ